MIQLIAPSSYGEFSDTLVEMHRLRHRVFKLRLAWDVQTSGDMEIDEFDALHPIYLTQVSENGRVQGSVRLLPSLGPTMLRDTFPVLLEDQSAPSTPLIWESSRSAIDVAADAPQRRNHGITRAAYELFAGMVEFGFHDSSQILLRSLMSGWKESFGGPAGRYDGLVVLQRLATQ